MKAGTSSDDSTYTLCKALHSQNDNIVLELLDCVEYVHNSMVGHV